MLPRATGYSFVVAAKKLSIINKSFVEIVAFFTTILMLIIECLGRFCYTSICNTGLISFDVGIFTSYARRSEANVRFQKVSLTANFISRVKALFAVPSFAPVYA